VTCSLLLVLASSGCFFHGCTKEYEVPLTLHEVHEWGVFQQQYGYNETVLSGGHNPGHPPMPMVVEQEESKPVIYFHGDGIGDVNVTVETNASNIITIPQAQVGGGTIHWNIRVAGGIDDRKSEAIVVDRDENKTRYDYLFYEGRNQDTQDVVAKVSRNGDNLSFNITNIGNTWAEDVFFWYHPGWEEKAVILAGLADLAPRENVVSSMKLGQSSPVEGLRSSLKEKLSGRGLTSGESEDFLSFWVDGKEDELGLEAGRTFFESDGNETAHILYFIPQSKYDAYLPLTIEPLPEDAAIRVGLVWLKDVPVEHQK